ncbi:MAG: YgiQ family radical SAM protein [Bacteroidales bacterium]|nr:YgiQ family radical SAM protein [Bacteroidales bacterium]
MEIGSFIPTTKKEVDALGWDYIDIILFTGDAYIDHPSFGAAVIARVLEDKGYRVAIVPQPNWRDDLRDFKKLGRPRLFFGVTSGAMDSMVNHYTAAKRLRSNDAYTPNGAPNMRPDYAVKVYSNILKDLYPDTPVVIGGIEASLRRLAHYDYWQDKLLPSILIDSKADYLIYGMGEKAIASIAEFIRGGEKRDKNSLNQIAWISKQKPEQSPDRIFLHSYEACLKNKRAFVENFNTIEVEANRIQGKQIIEQVGKEYVCVNKPYLPSTQKEMDYIWSLPYTKLPHPRYKGKHIPAYEMIKFSINTHRGCFGGCSFCTIAAHQGKHIQNRSEESILAEIAKLNELPGFAGNISDLGAPTANMYGMAGNDTSICEKCFRKSCLYPKMCSNLNNSHRRLLKLYERVASVKGINHAYIGSGIRYDLFLDEKGFLDSSSKPYFNELVLKHTSGRLKVAPEHTQSNVLKQMNKPSFALFERLKREFDRLARENKLKYQIVPYFISSHPGCTLKDMELLSKNKSLKGVYMDQVQDFTPTPMTKSSVSYYSEMDPKTFEPLFVEKNITKKREQKSYLLMK